MAAELRTLTKHPPAISKHLRLRRLCPSLQPCYTETLLYPPASPTLEPEFRGNGRHAPCARSLLRRTYHEGGREPTKNTVFYFSPGCAANLAVKFFRLRAGPVLRYKPWGCVGAGPLAWQWAAARPSQPPTAHLLPKQASPNGASSGGRPARHGEKCNRFPETLPPKSKRA